MNKEYKFTEEQMDEIVEGLVEIVKQTPEDKDMYITELFNQYIFRRIDIWEFVKMKTKLFDKCKEENIILDSTGHEGEYIGLPTVFPFVKRSNK